MASTLTLAIYPRYRWVVLATVAAGQIAASAFYIGWAGLTPFLRADFALTHEQVGLLTSATGIGSAVASAPAGRLGDRIGARRTLTAGLAAVAVVGLLTSFAGSFPLLLAGIFVAGLGYGSVNPAGVKALVPWFPRQQLGTAVAIKQIGYPVAGALTAATLPAAALALGSWRPTVAAVGVLVAMTAVGSLALVRDRQADRPKAISGSGRWWSAIYRRNLLLLCAIGLILASVQSAWVGHLVLFGQEGLNVPVTVGAGFLAASQIAAIAGRVGLGVLSDRLFGGRRRELLIACGLIAAAAAGVLPLLAGAPSWLIGLVAVAFGLSGLSWVPIHLAALADEGGEAAGGVTIGVGMAVGSIGVAVAPPLFGRAADLFGSYVPAWQGLAALAALAAALAAALDERVSSAQ